MIKTILCAGVLMFGVLCTGCAEQKQQQKAVIVEQPQKSAEQMALERILAVYNRPPAAAIAARPDEFLKFFAGLDLEPSLLVLVDKQHSLAPDFVPADLLPLTTARTYYIYRNDLSLRRDVEAALEEMSAAALADGIKTVVSSTYRSYAYQDKIYNRNVKQMGKAAADRESAMPGHSQHQLGSAIDFGSITDEFADTAAGKWLAAHAASYGFSLSFPQGMEDVTGYRWECWHYRYIGRDAVALQAQWFQDCQQYMIEFLNLWYSII